ncbi:MAG: hypothetical protein F7B17_04745 [Desulfurococcales archaeon]|nr:hypothetical protein [Desulfurococcales archaeon]
MVHGRPLVAVVPVSRDPVSFEAGVSSLSRAYEELGLDYALVLHSPESKEAAGIMADVAKFLLGPNSVEVKEWDWRGEGNPVDRLSEIIVDGAESLVGGDYSLALLVSPASRVQASIMSLVALSRRLRRKVKGTVDVVHVDFYFGPWTGLVYPYVPVPLEPLRLLHPESKPSPRGKSAASKMPELKPVAGSDGWTCNGAQGLTALNRLLGRLPPLRCTIAETARRLNQALWDVSGDGESYSITLVVDYEHGGSTKITVNPSQDGWVSKLSSALARSLYNVVDRLAREEGVGRYTLPLAAWSGITPLLPYGGRLQDLWGKPVIVDTNAIYNGIHVYAWSGLEVLLPECALAEVERGYAEALKELRAGVKGRVRLLSLSTGLAYLAFLDLKAAGSRIVPSPPGPCDTSIPKIDPLLLEGARVATGDSGAYEYWRAHPSSKHYGKPVKLYYDLHSTTASTHVFPSERDRISYTFYALHQAAIALCILKEITGNVDYELVVDGIKGSRKVIVPCRGLTESLGWRS